MASVKIWRGWIWLLILTLTRFEILLNMRNTSCHALDVDTCRKYEHESTRSRLAIDKQRSAESRGRIITKIAVEDITSAKFVQHATSKQARKHRSVSCRRNCG
ncbi:hypothetical protein M405DRAFT_519384 [Rhizopogon salebrosus TDB-379]|nr:hypothetical protein M405DRAFT_519384 [Rhizopogon salebrosus TDB-379]